MSNNNKGFTITITDNDSGNVLCEMNDARAIVGAISTEKGTRSIGFTRCNPIILAQAIGGAQKVIAEFVEEHPELNFIAQMIAELESLDSDSEDGGDSDDE